MLVQIKGVHVKKIHKCVGPTFREGGAEGQTSAKLQSMPLLAVMTDLMLSGFISSAEVGLKGQGLTHPD